MYLKTKLIKHLSLVVACLIIIGSIYYLGYKHASGAVKAQYKAIEVKRLEAELINQQYNQDKLIVIEENYRTKTNELKVEQKKQLTELQRKLDESNDTCINAAIPDDILNSLR